MSSAPTARGLMIQGTASHVGKSILVAGLGRLFTRRGWKVLPFKSQTMAMNSGVTPDGREIGRAQLVQALACGALPRWEMNPILLKESSVSGFQAVVAGKPIGDFDGQSYAYQQDKLTVIVQGAYATLAREADLVLIEGAGSPAELNFPVDRFVNMGMADMADVPVLLVGDIDRGGVFAALLGTLMLLQPAHRGRVKGLIVNKFRGEVAALQPGLVELAERTDCPVVGVVPYLRDLNLAEEDGVALEADRRIGSGSLKIAVLRLGWLANFTDLDALAGEPDITLIWTRDPDEVRNADLVVIPGSKATRRDLALCRQHGLAEAVLAAHRGGAFVLGICGGYQMLGRTIDDPNGVEAPAGRGEGLGLLEVETIFTAEKLLRPVQGCWIGSDEVVIGYEIHMGRTRRRTGVAPLFRLVAPAEEEGATSSDGRVLGTAIHGVLDEPAFRRALLNRVRQARGLPMINTPARPSREAAFDRLADSLEAHLDLSALESIIGRRT